MYITCYSWEMDEKNMESLKNSYIIQYKAAIIIEIFLITIGSIIGLLGIFYFIIKKFYIK